ncbi:MAG: DMT family transporter [Pseudomonadota bacterium]
MTESLRARCAAVPHEASVAQSDPSLGIRYVLFAMLCFAVQDGVSKYLAALYPVPFFVMLRYWVFAGFVLVLASRKPGGLRAAAQTQRPLLQIARGVLLVLQIVVFVEALDRLGLATTMAFFALYPLAITVLAIPILGETVGWRRMAAVGVGFLGVLVILRPGVGPWDPALLLGLLPAIGLAGYSLMTRIATQADGGSGPAVFYTGVAGAAAITLWGLGNWVPVAPWDWAWIALLALAAMTGHSCLIRAYDATEAVRLQPFAYLQMVFGVLVGWTVFAEPVDPWAILGMAMIVGAGLYALWRERRAAAG